MDRWGYCLNGIVDQQASELAVSTWLFQGNGLILLYTMLNIYHTPYLTILYYTYYTTPHYTTLHYTTLSHTTLHYTRLYFRVYLSLHFQICLLLPWRPPCWSRSSSAAWWSPCCWERRRRRRSARLARAGCSWPSSAARLAREFHGRRSGWWFGTSILFSHILGF